jgi:hypothetical protein
MMLNDPWDLLEEIEDIGGVSLARDANARLCLFNICKTIETEIPDEVLGFLTTVELFVNNRASEQDLENARVAAWNFHDAIAKTKHSKRNATRAVISALSNWKTDYEVYDSISYCMDFCSSVSDKNLDDEFCSILNKHLALS